MKSNYQRRRVCDGVSGWAVAAEGERWFVLCTCAWVVHFGHVCICVVTDMDTVYVLLPVRVCGSLSSLTALYLDVVVVNLDAWSTL